MPSRHRDLDPVTSSDDEDGGGGGGGPHRAGGGGGETGYEDETRKQRRLQRNRLSAQMHRRRQKEHVRTLEAQVTELSAMLDVYRQACVAVASAARTIPAVAELLPPALLRLRGPSVVGTLGPTEMSAEEMADTLKAVAAFVAASKQERDAASHTSGGALPSSVPGTPQAGMAPGALGMEAGSGAPNAAGHASKSRATKSGHAPGRSTAATAAGSASNNAVAAGRRGTGASTAPGGGGVHGSRSGGGAGGSAPPAQYGLQALQLVDAPPAPFSPYEVALGDADATVMSALTSLGHPGYAAAPFSGGVVGADATAAPAHALRRSGVPSTRPTASTVRTGTGSTLAPVGGGVVGHGASPAPVVRSGAMMSTPPPSAAAGAAPGARVFPTRGNALDLLAAASPFVDQAMGGDTDMRMSGMHFGGGTSDMGTLSGAKRRRAGSSPSVPALHAAHDALAMPALEGMPGAAGEHGSGGMAGLPRPAVQGGDRAGMPASPALSALGTIPPLVNTSSFTSVFESPFPSGVGTPDVLATSAGLPSGVAPSYMDRTASFPDALLGAVMPPASSGSFAPGTSAPDVAMGGSSGGGVASGAPSTGDVILPKSAGGGSGGVRGGFPSLARQPSLTRMTSTDSLGAAADSSNPGFISGLGGGGGGDTPTGGSAKVFGMGRMPSLTSQFSFPLYPTLSFASTAEGGAGSAGQLHPSVQE